MISLSCAARKALVDSMGLKAGERCLVITDSRRKRIGDAFFSEAERLGAEARLLVVPFAQFHGQEPGGVAHEMMSYDVIMIPTTMSMSHTQARKKACENGARIASMPGITEEMMRRTFAVDNEKMNALSTLLFNILNKGRGMRVKTKAGTDIAMSINRRVHGDYEGLYRKPGQWGNLPAGEACVSPLEGSAKGVYVLDCGSPLGTGMLDAPVRVIVENGIATRITGGKSAEELESALRKCGEGSRNIAELGIGTNDCAKITGAVLEDEKVMGTAHIALGDNHSLGGCVVAQCHLDGVFRDPTIWVDDKLIMKDGKLLVHPS
ncbi:MAG: aminopeptidase [archaeon]